MSSTRIRALCYRCKLKKETENSSGILFKFDIFNFVAFCDHWLLIVYRLVDALSWSTNGNNKKYWIAMYYEMKTYLLWSRWVFRKLCINCHCDSVPYHFLCMYFSSTHLTCDQVVLNLRHHFVVSVENHCYMDQSLAHMFIVDPKLLIIILFGIA